MFVYLLCIVVSGGWVVERGWFFSDTHRFHFIVYIFLISFVLSLKILLNKQRQKNHFTVVELPFMKLVLMPNELYSLVSRTFNLNFHFEISMADWYCLRFVTGVSLLRGHWGWLADSEKENENLCLREQVLTYGKLMLKRTSISVREDGNLC